MALAVLMPVVASMGGIAGTQTVTLIIRAIAVGQVQPANARWLFYKELAVGALNGLAWAAVIALATWAWFGTWDVAAIMFVAIVINLVAAAMAGVLIPMTLKRLRIDPALAGGVILDDRDRRRRLRRPARARLAVPRLAISVDAGAVRGIEPEECADLGAAPVGVALARRDQRARVGRLEQQEGQQLAAARPARAEHAQQRAQRAGIAPWCDERGLARVLLRLQQQRVDVAHPERVRPGPPRRRAAH